MIDINIGDGVYFKIDSINNYDLYWTVKSKWDNTLEIELSEMGVNDNLTIDIKYVYLIEKRTKK